MIAKIREVFKEIKDSFIKLTRVPPRKKITPYLKINYREKRLKKMHNNKNREF